MQRQVAIVSLRSQFASAARVQPATRFHRLPPLVHASEDASDQRFIGTFTLLTVRLRNVFLRQDAEAGSDLRERHGFAAPPKPPWRPLVGQAAKQGYLSY